MNTASLSRVIYLAGGCFWGTEKLFQSIHGVTDTEVGFANGRTDLTPDYKSVCQGDTGYRETVMVTYDSSTVTLEQLLKAYFYVVDPTVENRQGEDIGEQYQAGIYYTDPESEAVIRAYADREKTKYPRFCIEIGELRVFHPAEEYHQDYLTKNPGGYCHVPSVLFGQINSLIGTDL